MTPVAQTALEGQLAANARLGVFISYSRRDMAATDALVLELEAAGFAVTIDRRDLAYGEEWQQELAEFIRASDTVLWLVSPDSVTSKWCNWELGEVTRLHKRLLPVRLRETDNTTLPPALGKIHILPVEGVYDQALHLGDVVATLNTDQAWLKEGTHLAARAWQWQGGAEANAAAARRDNSALLTGAQLKCAQAWHLRQPANAPAPSAAVLELILASGDAARRRQRLRSVIAVAVLALAAALWSQYELAKQRQDTALLNESRTLTGLAQQSAADGDGVSAMLLAMAALPDAANGAQRPHLPDAERALYAALLDQRPGLERGPGRLGALVAGGCGRLGNQRGGRSQGPCGTGRRSVHIRRAMGCQCGQRQPAVVAGAQQQAAP